MKIAPVIVDPSMFITGKLMEVIDVTLHKIRNIFICLPYL